MHADLFNGDADGILARHQYRLVHPLKETLLVSGVKRDVKLCRQIIGEKSIKSLSIFDISLDSNRSEVDQLLENGVEIEWFDHHRKGDIQDVSGLKTHIDLSPKTCTSLIVYHHLGEATLGWAVAGAFGDNLREVAEALGLEGGLKSDQLRQLQALGETLNYNGYGESREDLAAWPVEVAEDLLPYADPFEYMASSGIFSQIAEQKASDEEVLGGSETLHLSTSGEITLLPPGAASRRMSGLFSNEKVGQEPDLAHAIFTHLDHEEGYRVSIRAPKNRPEGADELASRFPTGGGRASAAGVNELPKAELEKFCEHFDEVFEC